MKQITLISGGVVIAIALAIFFATRGNSTYSSLSQCKSNGFKFEIAQTNAEKATGLMNRKSLCEKCGMIFVYSEEKIRSFWMKDTLLPLDIYFFDGQGRFTESMINMRPMGETKDPMRRTTSKPAQYAIEVNTGIDFDTTFDPHECLNNRK